MVSPLCFRKARVRSAPKLTPAPLNSNLDSSSVVKTWASLSPSRGGDALDVMRVRPKSVSLELLEELYLSLSGDGVDRLPSLGQVVKREGVPD